MRGRIAEFVLGCSGHYIDPTLRLFFVHEYPVRIPNTEGEGIRYISCVRT